MSGELVPEICLLNKATDLDLSNNLLTGTLPDCLVDLISLERFSISDNSFTGNLPAGLLRLPNLQQARLDGNQFEGNIDVLFGAEWEAASSDENSSYYSDYYNVASTETLTSISLNNNKLIGGIPHQFSNFTSLVSFSVTENEMYTPVHDEICDAVVENSNSGYLQELFEVDCDKVSCSCCTNCVP